MKMKSYVKSTHVDTLHKHISSIRISIVHHQNDKGKQSC